jgi:hypothetical protein
MNRAHQNQPDELESNNSWLKSAKTTPKSIVSNTIVMARYPVEINSGM